MTIDPNSPLFKALLAMDSYNRGYDASLNVGTGAVNTYLGSAQIIANSTDVLNGDDDNFGFYAIAYQLPDESVIISYRGTDGITLDTLHGYGVGIGYAYTGQSVMAFDFFRAVADQLAQTTGSDPTQANISVTGHSLGGGLAGLVGAAYNMDGVLFNNMAFEDAVEDLEEITHDPNAMVYNSGFKQTVYGSATPWSVDYSGLQTIHTEGDFLGLLPPGFNDYQDQEEVSVSGLPLGS